MRTPSCWKTTTTESPVHGSTRNRPPRAAGFRLRRRSPIRPRRRMPRRADPSDLLTNERPLLIARRALRSPRRHRARLRDAVRDAAMRRKFPRSFRANRLVRRETAPVALVAARRRRCGPAPLRRQRRRLPKVARELTCRIARALEHLENKARSSTHSDGDAIHRGIVPACGRRAGDQAGRTGLRRREIICAHVLTGRKTLITFRAADVSCGSE